VGAALIGGEAEGCGGEFFDGGFDVGGEVPPGDVVDSSVGSHDGADGGVVGGFGVGPDTADRPAPGLDGAEDGVGGAVLGDNIVAVTVFLVDEDDGHGVGVLEAEVEVGEGICLLRRKVVDPTWIVLVR